MNQIYLKLEKSPCRTKKFENRAEFWDYLLKAVNSVLLDDIRRSRKFDEPLNAGDADDEYHPDAWDVVVSSRENIGVEARDALEKLFEKLGQTSNGARGAAILLLKAEGCTNEEILSDAEFKDNSARLVPKLSSAICGLPKQFCTANYARRNKSVKL